MHFFFITKAVNYIQKKIINEVESCKNKSNYIPGNNIPEARHSTTLLRASPGPRLKPTLLIHFSTSNSIAFKNIKCKSVKYLSLQVGTLHCLHTRISRYKFTKLQLTPELIKLKM